MITSLWVNPQSLWSRDQMGWHILSDYFNLPRRDSLSIINAASMVAGNSPTPTKKGVIAFLKRVTSVLSNDDWLTGDMVESIDW